MDEISSTLQVYVKHLVESQVVQHVMEVLILDLIVVKRTILLYLIVIVHNLNLQIKRSIVVLANLLKCTNANECSDLILYGQKLYNDQDRLVMKIQVLFLLNQMQYTELEYTRHDHIFAHNLHQTKNVILATVLLF